MKDEKTVYASVVNDTHIVAAPTKDLLTGTIARLVGGKAANLKANFKSALSAISPKSSMAFVVTGDAVGRLVPDGAKNNPQFDISKVDAGSFSISIATYAGGVFGAATMSTSSAGGPISSSRTGGVPSDGSGWSASTRSRTPAPTRASRSPFSTRSAMGS